MCGICGVVGFDEDWDGTRSSLRVDAMLQALHHRGPNAVGSVATQQAVLGATRLAVRGIDHPNQPSRDPESGVIVVCNGEIDNHRELREWLEQRGRIVPPGSDVEVLPGLYLELGESFIDRLVGAFALAVWDPGRRQVILARDRAGERPLFFTTIGNELVFASEVGALRTSGLPSLHRSETALRGYLQFGSFAAPNSPFEEVQKLAPGEILIYDARGSRRRRYWRWPVVNTPKTRPDLDRFDSIFREAVRRQSEVDIDFAVFLSGGLDSSLVSAVTRSIRPDRPLRGFTVRFQENSFDEGNFAEEVAAKLGIQLESVWFRAEDIPVELPALVRRVGEPLADPAWMAAALLSRAASQQFRMTLVGEGADELFGGYPTYLGAGIAEGFGRLPRGLRQWIRRGVHALPPSDKKVTVSYLLKRFVDGADLDGMTRHRLWNSNMSPQLLRRLGVEPVEAPGDIPIGPILLDRVQQWDLEIPLAEGLLTKADRSSMNSALELRAPFLDLGVMEFAATLPTSERVHGLTTKSFLKRYALRYLPHSIVHRRKRGLSVPLARWLRGPLHDWAEDLLSNPQLADLGLQAKAVKELFEEHQSQRADHARALWTLLVLSVWLNWAAESDHESGPIQKNPLMRETAK